MVGRAGRYGLDSEADAVLCVTTQTDRKKAVALMNRSLERVESCLFAQRRGLARIILEAIGIKIVVSSEELKAFLVNTLLFHQVKD